MTSPVFYVDAKFLASLEPGDSYLLDGPEGHHAKNVKRLTAGEAVDLADGRGLRVVGEVAAVEEGGLRVLARRVVFENSAPKIYLVQALAKNDRDLLGIETATELGVAGVVPWAADRSIVQWKGQRAEKAHAKWEKTVVAAAKQARRALIPRVYELYNSRDLAQLVSESVAGGAFVFVLHEREENSLVGQLRDLVVAPPQEIYLLVGPEGGISDREIDLLVDAGAVPVVLGSQVLRSSTAGSAAISALHAVLGHW